MSLLGSEGFPHFWEHITSLLSKKVNVVNGKGLSTEDYTTEEKNKLSGIEADANKTTVDSALSSSSTNPVQNAVVTAELDNKLPARIFRFHCQNGTRRYKITNARSRVCSGILMMTGQSSAMPIENLVFSGSGGLKVDGYAYIGTNISGFISGNVENLAITGHGGDWGVDTFVMFFPDMTVEQIG